MTTTLRPSGPQHRLPDGGTARPYEVRADGRSVGRIRITVRGAATGRAVGEISDLLVEERARRRGRGTVAVLAAEEVLRGQGCRAVTAGVPEESAAGRALAAALGYRPTARWMARSVPQREDPAGLGPHRSARPLTAAEFPAWLEVRARGYAALRRSAAGGAAQHADAAADADPVGDARQEIAALLPQGAATEDAVLRILRDRDVDVATLWLGFPDTAPPAADRDDRRGLRAWVHDVEVYAPHRRRGHGRAAMLLAEREARAAGARRIALHVHEGNTAARALYRSLGYRTTHRWTAKPLV